MAKCLLHKNEDLISTSRSHERGCRTGREGEEDKDKDKDEDNEKLGLETCAWNLSIGETETDGFLGLPGTFNELGTHTVAKLFLNEFM